MIQNRTVWELARMAGCYSPDTDDSPGARFLSRVQDDVIELESDGALDEDSAHEIADSAVPIYTRELWSTFVDLGAYCEDASELGATADDMDACARVCLYMIAERLASALIEESDEDDSDA